MARPQPTATELSRTLAGQWTKSEKRAQASREITMANASTRAAIKAFKVAQILNK